MSITHFVKIRQESEEVDRIQDQLKQNFDNLSDVSFLTGSFKKNVSLINGVTNVEHGLNKQYQGYIVTRITADTNVWETATNTLKDKYIILNASAAATVDIWFF